MGMFAVEGGSVVCSDAWVAPKNDLEGVTHSIEKWETLREYLRGHPSVDWVYNGSTKTCGLCSLHHTAENNMPSHTCCQECPIFKAGGGYFCVNTAYQEYADYGEDSSDPTNAESLAAIDREIEFLVSIKAGLEAAHG